MNKLTKGTIAAGVGVVLLLGSGSTLAYWNAQADLGTAQIQSGNLALTANGTPTWQVKHTSGAVTAVPDITALRIVPGDQLIYTTNLTVTAQGQNLRFTAALANGAIQPTTAGKAADVALASRLAQAATFTVNGAPTAAINVDSNTAKTYPVVVTVTLTWPFGDTSSPALDNPAKLGSVNLSGFAVTVTQTDRSL